jgi:hypothetical protein
MFLRAEVETIIEFAISPYSQELGPFYHPLCLQMSNFVRGYAGENSRSLTLEDVALGSIGKGLPRALENLIWVTRSVYPPLLMYT